MASLAEAAKKMKMEHSSELEFKQKELGQYSFPFFFRSDSFESALKATQCQALQQRLAASERKRKTAAAQIAQLEAKQQAVVMEALKRVRIEVESNAELNQRLAALSAKEAEVAAAKAQIDALKEAKSSTDAQILFQQQLITRLCDERQQLETQLAQKLDALVPNLQKLLGENREKTVAQIGRMLLDFFQGSFPRRCVLLPPPRGTLSERLHL